MRGKTSAVAVVGLVTCIYRVVSGEVLAGTSYIVGVKMGNCESYFNVPFIGDGQLWVLGPSYTITLKMGNCESYFNVSFTGEEQSHNQIMSFVRSLDVFNAELSHVTCWR